MLGGLVQSQPPPNPTQTYTHLRLKTLQDSWQQRGKHDPRVHGQLGVKLNKAQVCLFVGFYTMNFEVPIEKRGYSI